MASERSTKERLTALEKYMETIPALEGLVVDLKGRLDSQEETISSLNAKVASKDAQIEALEEAMTDCDDRLATLEASYKDEMVFLNLEVEELKEKCVVLSKATAAGGFVPGGRKVKPPPPRTYGGARDSKEVDNFIFDMEQFFRVSELDAKLMVDTATMYLIDDAKLWWRSKYAEIEAETVVVDSWDAFKKILKDQFYPHNTQFSARRRLRSIKHTHSIREYVKAFSACMLEIKGMTDDDQVFHFIDGLKEEAQREMMRQRYATLSEATIAAERLVDYHVEQGSPQRTGPQVGIAAEGDNTSYCGGYSTRRGAQTSPNSGSPSTGSGSEFSTAKKPVSCFLCQGGHWMSQCPHRAEFDAMKKGLSKSSMASLHKENGDYDNEEVVDEEDPSVYEDQPRMGSIRRINAMRKSGNSIATNEAADLMFVATIINGRNGRALIDTGATHNFVAIEEARRLGITWERSEGSMKAVNSVARRILGVARRISVRIGDWSGEFDFTIVQMDDFKLVLGMDFLKRTSAVPMPHIQSLVMTGPKPRIIKTCSPAIETHMRIVPRMSAMQIVPRTKRGRRVLKEEDRKDWIPPRGKVVQRPNANTENLLSSIAGCAGNNDKGMRRWVYSSHPRREIKLEDMMFGGLSVNHMRLLQFNGHK